MAEILWDCTQRPYNYGNQNHFTAAPPPFPLSTLIPICPPFFFLFLNNTAVKTAWYVLNIAVSSTFYFPPQELQYMVWNSPWSYLFESYPNELFTFIIIMMMIARFSNDCRKTKTKEIIPTNHNRRKQHYEPITIPSNYLQLAQSAGKITRTWCDWLWVLLLIGWKTGASLFSQSLRVAIAIA